MSHFQPQWCPLSTLKVKFFSFDKLTTMQTENVLGKHMDFLGLVINPENVS